MRIWKDVFTGDEMFSDAYPMKEVDDCVWEVEAKYIVEQTGDFGISANADEDAAEGTAAGIADTTAKKVINVVAAHGLIETQFDKKSYMTYIKAYMGRVKKFLEENNASRVAGFQTAAQNFVKKILARFDDFKFFTSSSMDPEAMVPLMYYREDGITPVFYFFKDGLKMEKY